MHKIGDGQTVRLIETVRLIFRMSNFRTYSTFNRVIWEKFQTVHLIQTVRIIESTEYLPISKKTIFMEFQIHQVPVIYKVPIEVKF